MCTTMCLVVCALAGVYAPYVARVFIVYRTPCAFLCLLHVLFCVNFCFPIHQAAPTAGPVACSPTMSLLRRVTCHDRCPPHPEHGVLMSTVDTAVTYRCRMHLS